MSVSVGLSHGGKNINWGAGKYGSTWSCMGESDWRLEKTV